MTLRTENCSWQALMDVAYDRWQKHNDVVRQQHEDGKLTYEEARKLNWGEAEHLVACTEKEREACILGKLNQQIENGGVIQWVDNGYAKNAIDNGLFELLDEMGPISRVIGEFLRSFCEDYMDEDSGEIQQYDDNDCGWEEAYRVSDRLSDRFYELQSLWHPEVYARIEG